MRKALFFLLTLPLITLAIVNQGVDAEPRDADVHCLIRSESEASGVRLEGVAVSMRPISGTYLFEVRTIGRAVTSSSTQGGTFETRGEEVVGRARLGLDRGAAYEAELSLSWEGGETSCSARGPDRS